MTDTPATINGINHQTIMEKLQQLARTRQAIEDAKKDLTTYELALEATPEAKRVASISVYLKEMNGQEESIKAEINKLGEDDFTLNGVKKPMPWYEVKSMVGLVYEAGKALEYAKTSLVAALALDKKAFEAVAKTGNLPTDVVKLVETPKVYIKSDLSELLKQD